MIFYGIVSAKTERVVEFFLERDAAEAITVEVRATILTSPTLCASRKSSSKDRSWLN